MDLQKVLSSHEKDIKEIEEWAESEYQKYFAEYFKEQAGIYKSMKEGNQIIPDSTLEWILTYLPLELFSVSENLSTLRTKQEVIKLHIKECEDQIAAENPELSATARKEKAASMTAEDRLLVDIYASIADRVNREISFSRELIMSAKKVWDARRASEGPMIGGIKQSDELPDYVPEGKQQYIG